MNNPAEIIIRNLTVEDLPQINNCLNNITAEIKNDIFISPSLKYVHTILNGYGQAAGAFAAGELIGFASIVFPKKGKHNIGHVLKFSDTQLMSVVQLEHICILSSYRLRGIATQLINYLLSDIQQEYKFLLSTVSPHNIPSLSLAFKIRQRIVFYATIYNVERFIMYKELPEHKSISKVKSKEVLITEVNQMADLLNQGYEGINLGANKCSIYYVKLKEGSDEKI